MVPSPGASSRECSFHVWCEKDLEGRKDPSLPATTVPVERTNQPRGRPGERRSIAPRPHVKLRTNERGIPSPLHRNLNLLRRREAAAFSATKSDASTRSGLCAASCAHGNGVT